jgi:hypothetical protein
MRSAIQERTGSLKAKFKKKIRIMPWYFMSLWAKIYFSWQDENSISATSLCKTNILTPWLSFIVVEIGWTGVFFSPSCFPVTYSHISKNTRTRTSVKSKPSKSRHMEKLSYHQKTMTEKLDHRQNNFGYERKSVPNYMEVVK